MIKRNVTAGMKYKILERDGFRCIYCGKQSTESELHIDHVIPFSKGGKTSVENLITACSECNLGKHDKTSVHEKRLLEIIRDRNDIFGYKSNEDIKSESKRTKKPKVYTVKKGWKIEHLTYDFDKEKDLMVEVLMESFTEYDKRIASVVLRDGVYFKEVDGRVTNVTYTFTKETFKELIGIEMSEMIDSENFKYYSLANHPTSGGKMLYGKSKHKRGWFGNNVYLSLFQGISYKGSEGVVKLELNMEKINPALDEIIDELIK